MRLWLQLVLCLQLFLYCHGDTLSEFLWKQTDTQHQLALKTKFVQGVMNKNLDPTSFGAYSVQDAVYCYHTKEVIDIALAKTKDPELKQFLQARSLSYESYAKQMLKDWHIEDPSGILLGPACANYVNHLYNVARNQDPIYLVPAMTPCAKLWPWIGQQLNASTGDFGVYTSWVKENFDPDSHGYIKYDAMIDSAEKRQMIKRAEALDVYTKSMTGEITFFSLD